MENKLEDFLSGDTPFGELKFIVGVPNTGKSDLASIYPLKTYTKEMADKVTENGQCILCDMINKLKENGFDTSTFKMSKTRYEKFGDTVFPVTYGPNGIVIVDYPNKPFVQDNQNPIVQDNQKPIIQNNQNDIIQDNT